MKRSGGGDSTRKTKRHGEEKKCIKESHKDACQKKKKKKNHGPVPFLEDTHEFCGFARTKQSIREKQNKLYSHKGARSLKVRAVLTGCGDGDPMGMSWWL